MRKNERKGRPYRCPHCFSNIDADDFHMVCTNENCLVTNGFKETDPERSIMFGIDPSSPDAPQATNHIVRRGSVCNLCHAELRIRVCPKCHHAIPAGAELDYCDTIMFLAPLNGGLSHYTVSVIEQIREILDGEFQGKLDPADSETSRRMRENYMYHINRNSTIPHSEAPSEPMVYYLNIRDGVRSKILTLIFVDVSCGTDGIPHLDHGTDIKGMISEASGIVLLVDPETESEKHNARGILSHMTDLIKSNEKVYVDGRIEVPLAVALTKCDLLMDNPQPLLGPCSAIHIRRSYGKLEDPLFDQIDAEVREIIRRDDGRELLDLAQNYTHNKFFAVSSIGYDPVDGSLPRGIIPFRVEDPLLWLLSRRLNQ